MPNSNITEPQVADILTIQRLLSRIGSYTDQKRWEEHRQLFTDEVSIDFGGVRPTQTISAADLMAWGRKSYDGVKTQHMVTNQDIEIDGDTATATAYGRALHERTSTGETWMIYARYEYTLINTASGWRVSRLLMEPTWQTGNPGLLE